MVTLVVVVPEVVVQDVLLLVGGTEDIVDEVVEGVDLVVVGAQDDVEGFVPVVEGAQDLFEDIVLFVI